MPQALPVPSAAASPVTVCAGPQPAETADSGRSFSDALSNELGAGDAPATPVTKDPMPAQSAGTGPDKPAGTATVAAGGNSLPPALPPEAMLTLSMLVPGTAPTQDAPTVPAGLAEHDTAPRTDSPAPISTSAAAIAMPAVALPVTTFTMPVPVSGQTDSADSTPAAIATVSSAAAAKPTVLAQRVAAAINLPNTVTATASAGPSVEADPTPVATKTDAEQIKTLTEGLKAVVTPTRAEPVADTSVSTAPAHASTEALASLAQTPGSNGSANVVPSATISVPFGQPTWGQALGNQVVWAMNQGLPAAALHLSPPELGPVSVHIRLDQDQASIAFSSPHVAVRDAIEAAMPRLRDMLGNQGIALVNVNVSQHDSSHAQTRAQDYAPGSNRAAVDSRDDGVAMAAPIRQVALGVLDLYA